MQSGGNGDNIKNRQRVQRSLADSGRCTFCPPHRGENHGATGKPDVRYNWDDRTETLHVIPSKGKDRK